MLLQKTTLVKRKSIAAVFIAAVLFFGALFSVSAFAEGKGGLDNYSVSLSDLVTKIVKGNGEAFENDYAKFHMLFGKIDGTMAKADLIEGEGDGGGADALGLNSETSTSMADCVAGFWRWQARSSDTVDAIIKIEFKTDMRFRMSHAADTAVPWATASSIKVVHVSGDDSTVVSNVQVEGSAPEANRYLPKQIGDHKIGDIVYVIYTGGGTTNFIPEFSFVSEMPYYSLGSYDLVTEMVKSEGEVFENEYAQFQLLSGKIDGTMNKMTNFFGEGVGNGDDAVSTGDTLEGADSVSFWRWQFKCTSSADAITKITLKTDLKITLTNEGDSAVPWAGQTAVKVVHVSGEDVTTVSDVTVDTTQKLIENYYYPNQIESVKAGDIVYIVYYGKDGGSGITTCVSTFHFGEIPDPEEEVFDQLYTHADRVKKSVEAAGETVPERLATHQLLYGDVNGELKAFAAKTANTDDAVGAVYDAGADFAAASVGFAEGAVKSSADKDAVIKVTAGQNLKLTVMNPAITGETGAGGTLKVFLMTGGTVYPVSSKEIVAAAEAGYYEQDVHMSSGDTAFIVYSSTTAKTYDKTLLEIKVDKTAFDMNEKTKVVGVEKLVYEDMILTTIDNEFKKVSGVFADYFLTYGSLADRSFKEFQSNEAKVLSDPTTEKNIFWTWQLRCSAEETMIVLTLKEDAFVKITHPKPPASPWATHSYIKMVAEDEDLTQLKLKDTKIHANAAANAYVQDVHLAAGDTLYIIYYMPDPSGSATTDFVPTFEIDPSLYDEDERPDFETMASLQTLRDEKSAALDTKVAGLDRDDYTLARFSSIEDIVSIAKADMQELMTTEEITACYNKAVADIDAVPTIEEENAELTQYKATKIAELEAYAAKKKYSKENQQKVQDIVDGAKASINASANKPAINTFVTSAKTQIDKIKAKGGCGSAVTGADAVIAGVLIVFGFILLKAKSGRREINE